MSLIASAKSGGSIQPIEAGTYPAVCCGLIDIGWQYSETYKKASPKIVIMWELPTEKIIINDEEVSRTISQTYTASLSSKSILRRDLVAWRGKEFTDEELNGFDLHNVIGAPCMISIVHKENNGSTYANISAIMKLPKGMEKPELTTKPLVFDLDSDPLELIGTLPQWIQNRIKDSETYKERTMPGSNSPETSTSGADPEFLELDEGEDGLPF